MDPQDEESLTPNHFLHGNSDSVQSPGIFGYVLKAIGQGIFTDVDKTHEKRCNSNLHLVIIADDNAIRNSWPTCIVIVVIPVKDGKNPYGSCKDHKFDTSSTGVQDMCFGRQKFDNCKYFAILGSSPCWH